MSDIVEKYRQSRLTKEELLQLRDSVNRSSDEAQAAEMQAHWEEKIDISQVDDDKIDAIQERLDTRIQASPTLRRRLWSLVQHVAVLLLPICLAGLGYMGYQQRLTSDDLLTVSTRQGEQVSIDFPDGTQTQMNERSIVAYRPHAFTKKHREIDFKGEAYFEVRHDADHPFLIHTPDVSVKVTGTKFNLCYYAEAATMTLSLFDGSVSLRSVKTREQIRLKPNERCTLDKATGHFTVEPLDEDSAYYTAWRRHELVFRSTPLKQVVEKLGTVYGVDIQLRNVNTDDRFTGTLPSSDFNKCLIVMSNLYHCKVSRDDNTVILTKNVSR
ncbi:FecR domain-containing protein [Prevotella sp. A2931]|uniref:FecR domain-containing protein n=1 Tax=Prevotella illustrans TaxID=2800387 RepID=A0ABS3M719_9BACT|nr:MULTISPECIES: FecR domain-containing protein [Prevotella]MBO1363969.1 FecR domain-containing protein [Prevotella illustrans]PTL26014.1 hypothetical protein C3V39_02395 [Prevotella sp. oral taxon 820]